MRIAFYVHSLSISGGTYVILQHAHWLRQHGFDVTIVYEVPNRVAEPYWHPHIGEIERVWRADLTDRKFDIAIATWWATSFNVQLIDARHYIYFVQSIESRFYTEGQVADRTFAELSYTLPMPLITEARWIVSYLEDQYGRVPRRVPNGMRKDVYRLDGATAAPRPDGNKLRVLVEGPLKVFFKNVEKAISLSVQADVGEVWLLTSSPVDHFPDVSRTFSQVSIEKVAEIYRSCDVILKLSYVEGMFGPPLEMFHCGGTAIVYDVTGHDEYIKNGENGIVIKRDDEGAVIHALRSLRDDPGLLRRLKEGALATARAWPNWEQSSRWFELALMEAVVENRWSRNHLVKMTNLYTQVYRELARLEGEVRKFSEGFADATSVIDGWSDASR